MLTHSILLFVSFGLPPNVVAQSGKQAVFKSELSTDGQLKSWPRILDEALAASAALELGLDKHQPASSQIAQATREQAARLFVQESFSNQPVSDEEVWQHYQSQEDRATIQQIQTTTREDAEQALKRIKAGEDFVKVAKELDISGSGQPGEVQRAFLPAPIAEVVFRLPLEQPSGIISTGLGFTVLVVKKRRLADRKNLTPAVHARLAKELSTLYAKNRRHHYVSERQKALGITIDKAVLKESGTRLEVPALADKIVARVGARNVTYADVVANVRQVFGTNIEGSHTSGPAVKEQIAQRLVEQLILEDDAVAKGFTKRAEVQQRAAPSVRGVLAAALWQHVASSVPAIGDAEAQKLYTDNPDLFRPAALYHLAHILVAEQQQAEDLADEIRAGADFAELAKRYSTDALSRNKGGELPPMSEAQLRNVDDAFAAAVMGLQPGKVMVVPTRFGFHVVRTHNKEVRPPEPYAEVAGLAKEQAHKRLVEAAWQKKLAELHQRSLELDTAWLKAQKLPIPAWAQR